MRLVGFDQNDITGFQPTRGSDSPTIEIDEAVWQSQLERLAYDSFGVDSAHFIGDIAILDRARLPQSAMELSYQNRLIRIATSVNDAQSALEMLVSLQHVYGICDIERMLSLDVKFKIHEKIITSSPAQNYERDSILEMATHAKILGLSAELPDALQHEYQQSALLLVNNEKDPKNLVKILFTIRILWPELFQSLNLNELGVHEIDLTKITSHPDHQMHTAALLKIVLASRVEITQFGLRLYDEPMESAVPSIIPLDLIM